jgi:gas vesicle protein
MSDTPETDAEWDKYIRHPYTHGAGDLRILLQRLERERDEAREHLREIKEYGTEEINAAVELRQKLAQALVDLDNMQDQRDLAMKVIKRLEQERDEAREELKNEMKWHHQTHKELIEAQCKLLDIEYDKLKS